MHVVHAVGRIGPRLDADGAPGRKMKLLDFIFNLWIGEAGLLDGLHVLRINVRVSPFERDPPCDCILVKVDNELLQGVGLAVPRDDDLGSDCASRPECLCWGFQVGNGLCLGRSLGGDEAKGSIPRRFFHHASFWLLPLVVLS